MTFLACLHFFWLFDLLYISGKQCWKLRNVQYSKFRYVVSQIAIPQIIIRATVGCFQLYIFLSRIEMVLNCLCCKVCNFLDEFPFLTTSFVSLPSYSAQFNFYTVFCIFFSVVVGISVPFSKFYNILFSEFLWIIFFKLIIIVLF